MASGTESIAYACTESNCFILSYPLNSCTTLLFHSVPSLVLPGELSKLFHSCESVVSQEFGILGLLCDWICFQVWGDACLVQTGHYQWQLISSLVCWVLPSPSKRCECCFFIVVITKLLALTFSFKNLLAISGLSVANANLRFTFFNA